MVLDFEKNSTLNKNRYRLYREHKYICYVFTELLRLISTSDLTQNKSLEKLKSQVKNLELLLQAHAEYEETRIHVILKNNNSTIFKKAENQHQNHKCRFSLINEKLNRVDKVKENEVHFLSYEIYLDLRNFFSENLNHFDYEERVIMPELQRLVADDEIREIDRMSYRQMTPDELFNMVEVLFPHMNCEDRFTFLDEIKNCEPNKFERAWQKISSLVEKNERNHLIKLLNI